MRCVPSISPQLLPADDCVALDFDLGFGDGQGGDGDEGAAGAWGDFFYISAPGARVLSGG